ncbi:MAG: hypothetical protein R2857_01725 [Vampirovibrionales bacterium]
MVKKPSGDGLVVADIPGLIEGASQRRVRAQVFTQMSSVPVSTLHLIDISSLAEFGPLRPFT